MKRKVLLAAAVLLMVAVGMTVWVESPDGRSRIIVLTDGSRLEYLGATVGANCSFDYGSPWQRLAARLPGKWTRKFGGGAAANPVVNAGYSGDSSVVFWFVRRGSPAQTNATKVIYKLSAKRVVPGTGTGRTWNATWDAGFVDELMINLKDEQGDGVPGLHCLSEAALPSGDTAVYWRTEVVPANGRVVFLRFYEPTISTGLKYTGEIDVPNPLRGNWR